MKNIPMNPGEEIRIVLQKQEAIIKEEPKNDNSIPEIVNNRQFCDLMSISNRTAQTWRDESIVKFSQIKGKIYYNRADILELLDKRKV